MIPINISRQLSYQHIYNIIIIIRTVSIPPTHAYDCMKTQSVIFLAKDQPVYSSIEIQKGVTINITVKHDIPLFQ